ncbi:MAG: hypothetical protein ABW098_08270 [Candidatus Thiodiazotropha sp.]
MKRHPDRLFELLPVVHRQRDAELGYPLRALLQVIGEQVDIVEDDIDQLYENWFIETCEEWVVPYLGDLIGYRSAHEAGQPGDIRTEQQRALNKILTPRREVANTIRNRRRKGTLALLELLARDIADWPARAVEFYRLLAWMQPLNHQRLERGRSVDLRDALALERVDGPFDSVAHTVDVRRLSSCRTRGRYNIPNVGLFVWRLKAYPISWEPAYCHEDLGSHCYTFSVLGNDAPLYTRPSAEPSPYHIAGPLNLPIPITRRALQCHLQDYYGSEGSFTLWADGWGDQDLSAPIPAEALVVADLSHWRYRPQQNQVAIDPVLGRIVFPPRQLPRNGVWVAYHYGFSDDMGAGEYKRSPTQPEGAVTYRVGSDQAFERINDALVRWREEAPEHAVVEITDGGVYTEQINIELGEGQSLQLRSIDGRRALLRLMDWHTARPDALSVVGEAGSRFTLDGLVVAGRSVQCQGALGEFTLRHSTLVPGWTIDPDCDPLRPAESSLQLIDTQARVTIDHSILGSIQVSQDEVGSDPVNIHIHDSILDATSPQREAIGAPTWPLAHAVLVIERTTVFGTIETHAIDLAENSIFLGLIKVARRQRGCIRFSYVTPGSRTPRRYRCQPDLAEQAAKAAIPKESIGPPAKFPVLVAGADADAALIDCGEDEGGFNLQLELHTSDPTPEIDDIVIFTLNVRNNGPRNLSGIEVAFDPPMLEGNVNQGCLEAVDGSLTLSQGIFNGDDDPPVWIVGDLQAGKHAMLSVPLEIMGVCVPDSLLASITAFTWEDDGQAHIDALIEGVRARVKPRFSSRRYGNPGYAQLLVDCSSEITRGADDESEMGAFHDLFQPQRMSNLEARLEEFVPAGMDIDIILSD